VTMRAMFRRSPRLARSSILLIASLVAFAGLAAGPVAHPVPTNAATASYVESLIVRWVNHARENRGIPPLKVGVKLTDLAGDRAATLAKTEKLVHPNCLSCTFNSYDISYSSCGEVIAYTTYPWGYEAAHSIFLSWKHSPGHWSLLMSRSFHRLGMGVAYRSSDHSTWASGDLAG
jgi:uncharacterized protein YkwD